jgi:hypothetical protein
MNEKSGKQKEENKELEESAEMKKSQQKKQLLLQNYCPKTVKKIEKTKDVTPDLSKVNICNNMTSCFYLYVTFIYNFC